MVSDKKKKKKKKKKKNNNNNNRCASGEVPVFGAIFMSNSSTKNECFRKKLLGLPASASGFVKQVKAGMVLFLFEYERRVLYGVYQACSDGGMDLSPNAFKSAGSRFPAQVRFRVIWLCSPLSENEFRSAIEENYFAAYKFNFGLSKDQVRKLLWLFSSRKLKDGLPPRQFLRGNASGHSVSNEAAVSPTEDDIYGDQYSVENQFSLDHATDPMMMYPQGLDAPPRLTRVGDSNSPINTHTQDEIDGLLTNYALPIPFDAEGGGRRFLADAPLTSPSVARNVSIRTSEDGMHDDVSDCLHGHPPVADSNNPLLYTNYSEASIMRTTVVDHPWFSTHTVEDFAPRAASNGAAITAWGATSEGRFLVDDAECGRQNVTHAVNPLTSLRYPHYQLPEMRSERQLASSAEAPSGCNLDDGGRFAVLDLHFPSGKCFQNAEESLSYAADSVSDVNNSVGFCQSTKPPKVEFQAQKSFLPSCLIAHLNPDEVPCSDSVDVSHYQAREHFDCDEEPGYGQQSVHRIAHSSLTPGTKQYLSHTDISMDSSPCDASAFRRSDLSQAFPSGSVSHAMNSAVPAGVREPYQVGNFESVSPIKPHLGRMCPVRGENPRGVNQVRPIYDVKLHKSHCRRPLFGEDFAADAVFSTDREFIRRMLASKDPRKKVSVFDRLNYASCVGTKRVDTHGKSRVPEVVDDNVMEMVSQHCERVKRAKLAISESSVESSSRLEKVGQSQVKVHRSMALTAWKLNENDAAKGKRQSQLTMEVKSLNMKSQSDVRGIQEEANADVRTSHREVPADKPRKRKKLIRPDFTGTSLSKKTDAKGEEVAVSASASEIIVVDSVNEEADHVKEQLHPMADKEVEIPLENERIQICEALTQNFADGDEAMPNRIGVCFPHVTAGSDNEGKKSVLSGFILEGPSKLEGGAGCLSKDSSDTKTGGDDIDVKRVVVSGDVFAAPLTPTDGGADAEPNDL